MIREKRSEQEATLEQIQGHAGVHLAPGTNGGGHLVADHLPAKRSATGHMPRDIQRTSFRRNRLRYVM